MIKNLSAQLKFDLFGEIKPILHFIVVFGLNGDCSVLLLIYSSEV